VIPRRLKRRVDFVTADANVALDSSAKCLRDGLNVLRVTCDHVHDRIRLHRRHPLLEFSIVPPVTVNVLGVIRKGNVALTTMKADNRVPRAQQFFDKIRSTAARAADDEYSHVFSLNLT
jgi:hypothetical protein